MMGSTRGLELQYDFVNLPCKVDHAHRPYTLDLIGLSQEGSRGSSVGCRDPVRRSRALAGFPMLAYTFIRRP
eukprot:4344903-Amphidinium_carterae.1